MPATRRQVRSPALRRRPASGRPRGLTIGDATAGVTEVVTELAVQFSERGLAGVGLVKRPEVVVTLIRAGVRAQKYRLRKGSTLDDLLDRAGALIKEQSVLVDEVVPERSLVLYDLERPHARLLNRRSPDALGDGGLRAFWVGCVGSAI